MTTPTGKVERESVSFPVVNGDFCIVHLALAGGAGANLVTAIQAQLLALGAPSHLFGRQRCQSPSSSPPLAAMTSSLGRCRKGALGIGIKIAAGSSMLLGFSGTPADPLLYQCAGVCAVACYF